MNRTKGKGRPCNGLLTFLAGLNESLPWASEWLLMLKAGPKTVKDACYLCISWSKNSDRCLIPFVSAGSKTVTDA